MLISRTPLRVSLFGGGTDFEAFYKVSPGRVVSFTIDRSIYVSINKRFDGKLHLRYSRTELAEDPDGIRHDIVKECLKIVGVRGGVEIVLASDVPSVGTGLGTSGALTIGVLKALFAFTGREIADNTVLGSMACSVEIDRLKAPIGKQDQYACAMGGLNEFVFHQDGVIAHTELYSENKDMFDRLLNSMMLFYLPNGRKSAKILKVYKKNMGDNRIAISRGLELADEFVRRLKDKTITENRLAEMLTENWMIKKNSSPASNVMIEKAWSIAMKHGGIGGKMCGAGGGGFLLVVSQDKTATITAMEDSGFRFAEVKLWNKGSDIVYRS